MTIICEDRHIADPAVSDDGVLPDLPTMVALAGTVHRAEVGGNVCFNTVVTIAIVVGR